MLDDLDDQDGESSLEEPQVVAEEDEYQAMEKGDKLVGKEVYVVYDNVPLLGSVTKYVKDGKCYWVKFADKTEKDVLRSEMSRNKNDCWIDCSKELVDENPNKPFTNVVREYDRVLIRNADSKDALDFFLSFYSFKFWTRVCKETVRYAQTIKPTFTLHVNELLRWIALVIIWGIYHHFPSPNYFWSTHWVFNSHQVARIMTNQRFKEIGRFLHLANNEKDDKKDSFFKVRKMSDDLNVSSVANYRPHCELSFDEMSPGSQHRTHLVVRTKHKKVPSAFDVKALCDAHNKYLIQHRLSAQPPPEIPNQTKTSSQVIAVLKASDLQQHHRIYFDNLYATVALFNYLFVHFKVYAVGTWRKNYGVPKDLQRDKVSSKLVADEKKVIKKMARNTFSKEPLLIGAGLYDSKPFYMLSSIMYPFLIQDGGTKSVSKFDIQHDYNKFMCGVDLNDQLQISYNTYITSRKWWKRLFFFLLDLAIINSYILMKIVSPNLTHLEYRLQLVTKILEKYVFPLETPKKRRNNDELPSPTGTDSYKRLKADSLPPIRLELGTHYPVANGTDNRRSCKVCTLNGTRSTTSFSCSLCKVDLCIKPDSSCWTNWHSKQKFVD